MGPLHVAVLALKPLVPFGSGHLHLVTDSIIGVAVGIVVVVIYLAVLRWSDDSDSSSDRQEDRQPDPPG